MSGEASPYVNIAGLLNVQSNYLADVGAGTNSDGVNAATNLSNINNQLNGMASAMANTSTGYLLTGQDTVYTILAREKDRITEKAKSIDIASQGQDRLIQLNTNYKKRYAAYNSIIIAAVLALIVFAGIIALRSVPFIPAVLLNVASIALLAVTAIYCGSTYVSIVNRDSIYFDELDTNSTYMKSVGSITHDISGSSTTGAGSGLNFNIGSCLGQQCCSGNTFWNSTDSVCMPACAAGQTRNPTTFVCA
jgi:hypothetical protein